jgi:hypothetical protein
MQGDDMTKVLYEKRDRIAYVAFPCDTDEGRAA